jgi:beta-galactosidase
VVFKVADKFGASRAFGGGTVRFEISGPGEIIGDNPFDLAESGGAAAIWVKTRTKASGSITLTARHSELGAKTVRIGVKRDRPV